MARVAEGLGVSWNTAPQSSHPQDPYILCLTASPQHPRYALRIRKSQLWVAELNPRARRFYERNGFHPDGARYVDETLDLAEVRHVR